MEVDIVDSKAKYIAKDLQKYIRRLQVVDVKWEVITKEKVVPGTRTSPTVLATLYAKKSFREKTLR
jgi:hypothetical protein